MVFELVVVCEWVCVVGFDEWVVDNLFGYFDE